MSLFQLLSSPSIGVEFSEGGIRMAIARRQGREVQVLLKAGDDLPQGALSDGVIREAAQVQAVLQKLCNSFDVTGKHAVLLIPPRNMYTHLLHLPAGKWADDQLRAEIAKCIPEEIDDLQCVSRVLKRSTDGVDIGVAAVRRDVLRAYVDSCQKAGLRVSAVTTFPCVLAQTIAPTLPSILLVCAPKGRQYSITVFLQQWPIDEVILPADTKDEDVQAQIDTLMSEYKPQGIGVEQIVTYGEPTKVTPSVHVEESIPWMQNTEREFVPAVAASAVHDALAVSLLGSPRHRLPKRTFAGVAIALPVCVVAGFFAYRFFLPLTPIPGPSNVEVPKPLYDEAITWATERHVFTNASSPEFQPDAVVTRQEFLRAVVSIAVGGTLPAVTQQSGFTDVDGYPDLIPILRYAKSKNMLSGAEFRPDDPINVAAALKMAYVALGIDPQDTTIDPWYAPYRKHALAHDVLFDPSMGMETPLTRKDAAWMVWKVTGLSR